MQQGWLDADRRRGAIVLEVFGRLVSALERSEILSSSVWEKSTVGQMMASISPSETLCIVSSSLMCPSRSGVLAELVGDFLADLKKSELPSLPPKLASNMTSLSGLEDRLEDTISPSVGRA